MVTNKTYIHIYPLHSSKKAFPNPYGRTAAFGCRVRVFMARCQHKHAFYFFLFFFLSCKFPSPFSPLHNCCVYTAQRRSAHRAQACEQDVRLRHFTDKSRCSLFLTLWLVEFSGASRYNVNCCGTLCQVYSVFVSVVGRTRTDGRDAKRRELHGSNPPIPGRFSW